MQGVESQTVQESKGEHRLFREVAEFFLFAGTIAIDNVLGEEKNKTKTAYVNRSSYHKRQWSRWYVSRYSISRWTPLSLISHTS
jgi:hypothetical protein